MKRAAPITIRGFQDTGYFGRKLTGNRIFGENINGIFRTDIAL